MKRVKREKSLADPDARWGYKNKNFLSLARKARKIMGEVDKSINRKSEAVKCLNEVRKNVRDLRRL